MVCSSIYRTVLTISSRSCCIERNFNPIMLVRGFCRCVLARSTTLTSFLPLHCQCTITRHWRFVCTSTLNTGCGSLHQLVWSEQSIEFHFSLLCSLACVAFLPPLRYRGENRRYRRCSALLCLPCAGLIRTGYSRHYKAALELK